ncbi:MAG: hypothetical protein ACI8RD_012195 [Bacillariaceae sp.]|jgi:hypothetical protein
MMTNQHNMARLAMALPLLLVGLLFVVQQVHAQEGTVATIKNYCGVKSCIEALSMPCEEVIETYKFQGSCCSLESVPQLNACRITVSYGNCFWYPFCGDCDANDQKELSRCNNLFETDANIRPCPTGSFDPLAIQSNPEWTPPSCSPTMSPTNSSQRVDDVDDESTSSGNSITADPTTSTTKRVVMMIISTAIIAFIATTV